VAKLPAIVAALTAVVVALPSLPARAAADPLRTTTVPGAAAAGWLAQQFGDHLDFPASTYFDGGATADAVFALAAARSGRTKIDRTMRYFAAHIDDYTNLQDTDGKPGPYDGSVAKAAAAVVVAGHDPRSFGSHDLISALHHDQCTAVSAPKNAHDFTTPTCPAVGAARNIFSSVSESFAILAEGRAAAAGGAALGPDNAALAYFFSLQCPDGGFTVETSTASGCSSDVDATGYALMALQSLTNRPQDKIRAAAGWLRRTQRGAGYWVSQGAPNVDSTGLAAAALDGAGQDTPAARAWLAAQQVRTGPTVGAGAARGALAYQGRFDASSAVKATSDGTLGLVRDGSLATLSDAAAAPDTAVLALAAPTLAVQHVRPGGTDRVTGTGFSRGETVTGTLGRTRLASLTADKNGTVAADIYIPRSVAAGTYALTLAGRSSGLSSSTTLAVRAAPTPAQAPPVVPTGRPRGTAPILAATGAPAIAPLLAGGGGSIILGAVALRLGRRRRA
jgi:hypothetical protein